jgi:parallel beta-helix repeat protein
MILQNDLKFDGIDFTGSNKRAFYIASCSNITIQNCNFDYHGLYAVWGGNNHGLASNNFVFKNNTVNHVNSQGIVLQSEYVNPYIGYNSFKNCGVLPGMFKVPVAGGQWDGAYGGVVVYNTNGFVFEYNFVDSSGYTAVTFTGNNTRINNNHIQHCQMQLMDGGSIYTWTGPAKPTTGSKIYNNIVHDGIGDDRGTPSLGVKLVHGIYLDDNTANTEVYGNTCFNFSHSGIYIHNTHESNIHDNTAFNNGTEQFLFAYKDYPIRNNIFKNNIAVSKSSNQLVVSFSSPVTDITSFFTMADSNYYARPIDDNITVDVSMNNYTTFGHYNLAQWSSFSGYDIHSKKSPKTVTSINDLRLEFNPTSSSKTIILDGNYIDVKNVSYNGSITLAPYTSAVLIRNGAATNQAPTANAGADQSITLPTNTVNLSGSGTDPDGSISSYYWIKTSGPSAGVITNSNSASTSATGLVEGVYKFELKVTDNGGVTDVDTVQIIVNAAPNILPVADAGSNITITLPVNTISLAGSGSDPDGTIANYTWAKISGPASYNIVNSSSPITDVSGLVQGIYKFELKVTDNKGAIGKDTVQVTVNAAANISPTANAGTDQSITLPTNTVSLSGSGTDPDGSISSYYWTKTSGPSAGVITNSNSASTSATGLVEGVYQFQLKVTDNSGATAINTVQVTVYAANVPPVANAGIDQSITLPTNSVNLLGGGTDADGIISSYDWAQISGPSSGSITNSKMSSTSVTGMVEGIYQFRLRVTDNDGAIDNDTVQIIVNPVPNIAPTANAGKDQVITLPINITSLAGNGSDPDGTIINYKWSKLSGPTSYNIVNISSPVTDVSGLDMGVYQFELKVTDNDGAIDIDTVQIIVKAADNIPPVADAGKDQTINLPVDNTTLAGTANDPDGIIKSYKWSKISGPALTIVSPQLKSTSVMGLAIGIYKIQLMVTDNAGATGTDTVILNVNQGTLPLNLLSFKGQLISDKVNLTWKTANEKNVSGFDIERMAGTQWEKIGNVKSIIGGIAGNNYLFNDYQPLTGFNYYRLKIVDIDGKYVYSDIVNIELKPNKNVVYQNVPNSFSATTTIRYDIAEKDVVKIFVYNSAGAQVAVLANEEKEPGTYQVKWNASNFSSGNYFYTVFIGDNVTTKQMIKIK